jgi:archaemetzincin
MGSMDRVTIFQSSNSRSVEIPRPLQQVVPTRSRRFPLAVTLFIAAVLLLTSCTNTAETPASNITAARAAGKERKELRDNINKIEPFFKPMGKPSAYDCLASFNEPGQTFEEYLDANPTKPTKERQKIYVLPLGTFTPKQKQIIDITAGYLAVFYDLPVSTLPARSLPKPAREQGRNTQRPANASPSATPAISRRNPYTKVEQIRTGYLMQDVLKPILPTDAAALIAFTNDDLYPDETMSYVFGQASFDDRVGVWSLFRLGEHADIDTFLRRTLKIAAHETGHMFSMRHCIKYECVMSGTNHLGETDSRPIDACPECTAKICWLSDADQAARYDRLAEFCRKNGLTNEANEFTRKAAAVRSGHS